MNGVATTMTTILNAERFTLSQKLKEKLTIKYREALTNLFSRKKAEMYLENPALFALAMDRVFEYAEFSEDEYFMEALVVEVTDDFDRQMLTVNSFA
jgi:hypothetical protein